jgi:hypothetical protein
VKFTDRKGINTDAPPFPTGPVQGIVFLYLGYVDAWAGVAYVSSWVIAFGCTVVYFFTKRALDKRKQNPSGSVTQ